MTQEEIIKALKESNATFAPYALALIEKLTVEAGNVFKLDLNEAEEYNPEEELWSLWKEQPNKYIFSGTRVLGIKLPIISFGGISIGDKFYDDDHSITYCVRYFVTMTEASAYEGKTRAVLDNNTHADIDWLKALEKI